MVVWRTMGVFDPLLQGGIQGGILLTFGIGYWKWLRDVEDLEDRQKSISDTVVGYNSPGVGQSFEITQVGDIDEKSSLYYHIKKRIPIIRSLQGWIHISLETNGAMRDYVWEEDEYGIIFSDYLTDVVDKDNPEVEILNITPSYGRSTDIPKLNIQIRVRSLRSNSIKKIVRLMAEFQEYYFENFPGDRRDKPIRGRTERDPESDGADSNKY